MYQPRNKQEPKIYGLRIFSFDKPPKFDLTLQQAPESSKRSMMIFIEFQMRMISDTTTAWSPITEM